MTLDPVLADLRDALHQHPELVDMLGTEKLKGNMSMGFQSLDIFTTPRPAVVPAKRRTSTKPRKPRANTSYNREAVRQALVEAGGRRAEAGVILGIARRTMTRWVHEHHEDLADVLKVDGRDAPRKRTDVVPKSGASVLGAVPADAVPEALQRRDDALSGGVQE